MNIGITLHLELENESIWSNGIKLNALYLLKALKEIGYNAYLLNAGPIQAPYEGRVQWNVEDFPIYDYNTKMADTDLMIWLGATYSDDNILNFKKTGKNKKVVKYICGNNYLNDAEASMFVSNFHAKATGYNQAIDEAWYVPQQEEMNREYYRLLHNLPANKVRPVPFVWDPIFIDRECEQYYTSTAIEANVSLPVYRPGKANEEKQLACFEPNIGIQKWHLINYLAVEDYLNSGGKFKKLNIVCGDKLLKNEYYISVINRTRLFNEDPVKVNYLPRLKAVNALSQFADVVLAHQHTNPLNYSYLDALYLQFPLVHNAPMIKDAGYYYNGNSIGSAARQLKLAIEKHDENMEEYNERSEKVLTRYTVYNDGLLETYKKLIETTMGIKDHKLSSMYDWTTNLYK